MQTIRGHLGGVSIAALLLAACGGGGGGTAPPAFDATGHWMTWLTDPVTMQESGPFGSYMTQTGGSVDGVGVSGTVSGNDLNMSADLGLINLLTFTGTMSGNQITGTYQMIGLPLIAAFRMQQFTPTGTLTANGTVGGMTVAVNSTTAFGERKYDDLSLTNLTAVNVVDDDGMVRFEIDFTQPGSLAPGILDASVVPVTVYAGDDMGDATVQATSGTVSITQYGPNGFTATFNLTLPMGESVSGSFDVVYDLDAYDPP